MERISIQFDYDPDLVQDIKTIDGAKWIPSLSEWSFPASEIYRLANVLDYYLPSFADSLRKSKRFSFARDIAEGLKEEIVKSKAVSADLEIPCPEGQQFLPFQKAGINYMKDKESVLLADDMGLGKTVQTLGLINIFPSIESILVICPASVKTVWEREAKKWLVRDTYIETLYNNPWNPPQYVGMYIINYDIITKYFQYLCIKWDLVICDEAHKIKNPSAQRTITVNALLRNSKRKLFLTGTPIVNRPYELFPLLRSLRPDYWNSAKRFRETYCFMEDDGYGIKWVRGKNLDKLQADLRKLIMIRRTKNEVLTELPPKRRQIIEITPTTRHRKALDNEKKNMPQFHTILKMYDTYRESSFREAMKNLKGGLFRGMMHIAELRHITALSKVQDCYNFIQQTLESKEKVVVFAHHRDVIEQLCTMIGPSAVKLYGGMTEKQKQKSIDSFQKDEKIKVFVGSITAAGVGITLHAADTAIFCELDWVPGNITQAEDRLHRIGQANSVIIYHLVLVDSIDAYLARTIIDKQEIIDQGVNYSDKIVDTI